MKSKPCFLILTGILLAVSMVLPETTLGQEAGKKILRIRKLDGDKVKTPQYRIAGGTVQGRSRRWYAITTEYETAPEWIDQLDFQYYILMKSKKGEREFTLFRGGVTYINIEHNAGMGRHKSVVYLHPSTLSRYGEVERMAVIVKHDGRLVGMESEPSSTTRWWEQLAPQSGYILNRMQTPFAMINFDDYEAIKAKDIR